ncbi:MAG: hypothetical protein V3T60_15990 [Candidatus Binatia bacterium]
MRGKSDEVFVIENGDFRVLPSRPYRAGLFGKTLEEALQILIEKDPRVLPGKQMDPGSDDPPRFVLLRREMPVGGGSLDHLLVDQRAVLTLVEAKLIQNSEARREVIGQIMEYAASAAQSWGNGRAREKAREFWQKCGKDVDELIRNGFERQIEVEAFWSDVEQNLQKGKVRLIIAADELRPEVRRTIEYLNTEMSNVEVYGLELRCYGDDSDSLVLVPYLIGQTQATADRKGSSELTWWSVDRLRDAYDNLPNRDIGERLREALDWAVERGFFEQSKTQAPTFALRGRSGDRIVSFFSDGTVYCFINDKHYPGGEEERDRFVAELKGLALLDSDLDPREVNSGRNLARKLTDLTEAEFQKLVEIFSHFCKEPKTDTVAVHMG